MDHDGDKQQKWGYEERLSFIEKKHLQKRLIREKELYNTISSVEKELYLKFFSDTKIDAITKKNICRDIYQIENNKTDKGGGNIVRNQKFHGYKDSLVNNNEKTLKNAYHHIACAGLAFSEFYQRQENRGKNSFPREVMQEFCNWIRVNRDRKTEGIDILSLPAEGMVCPPTRENETSSATQKFHISKAVWYNREILSTVNLEEGGVLGLLLFMRFVKKEPKNIYDIPFETIAQEDNQYKLSVSREINTVLALEEEVLA